MAMSKAARFLNRPVCEVKVACDGNTLVRGRTLCSPCEEKLARIAKAKDAPVKFKGVPSRKNKRKTAPTDN